MRPLVYDHLFPALWMAFALYWWLRSLRVKATARRDPLSSRLLHIVPLLAAILLLWVSRVPVLFLDARFLPCAAWPFWAGAALTAAGLLFAVWARSHLGSNWSATVSIKKDHELVTSGPYAFVRHPIYTGLLLAFVGTALARGEWRGILALALVSGALWRKLKNEERWLRELFGESYEEYAERVSAVLPFLL